MENEGNRKVLEVSCGKGLKDLAALLSKKMTEITPEEAKMFEDYCALQGKMVKMRFDKNQKCIGLHGAGARR